MQWEDDFFKDYIIDQRVGCVSDLDWDYILKEKPFLTRYQISKVLTHARTSVEVKGPLYEQIAAFRSRNSIRRSPPKWIEERKWRVSQICDDMMKTKLNKTLSD